MKPMHALAWAGLLLAAALTWVGLDESAQSRGRGEPFAGILDEHPAIGYANRPTTDRVGRLATALASGAASLTYHEPGGYLHSLLSALDISPESQLLVFSKTGVQRASTSPRNPRALYFNDTVVVGYIAGARFIEIAAHDPQQGVVFYTVDQMASSTPDLARQIHCLTCHVSGSTLDVPGMITRSNFTRASGEIIPQLGFNIVDHRTPLAERWGGWFVTGRYDLAPYGGVTHMGNVATSMHPDTEVAAGSSNEIFFQWMDANAGARGYPSHESDIAALMVFDHQMRAINLLTRFNWESRVAEHDGGADFTRGDLRQMADAVADYLLFVDEAPPPARLLPRAGFATEFVSAGPKDSSGRSLRELELTSRLFKYSCSYMIHSPAFDGLPAGAKLAVYQRLSTALRGQAGNRYRHLTPENRVTISEILRETKTDWPLSP